MSPVTEGSRRTNCTQGLPFSFPFCFCLLGALHLPFYHEAQHFAITSYTVISFPTKHPALPMLSTVPSVQNWDNSWHMGAPGLTQINAFCRNAALVSFVMPLHLLGRTLWCSSSEKISFFSFLLIEVDIIDILQCDISTFND